MKFLGKSFKIFTLFDIPVYFHSSFLLMMVLIVLINPQLSILFISAFAFVLMHEFGHCIAAKWCNMYVESITMLPIGGLAMIADLTKDPKKELLVSFAGPFINAALVSFFSLPLLVMSSLPMWMASTLILWWWVNVILFTFNMLPVFPMDGGRIFRAVLCLYWGDFVKATKIAAGIGKVLASIMVMLGIYMFYPMWIALGIVIIILGESESRKAIRLSS